MIVSFANKETERLFAAGKSRKLPPEIIQRAIMRLTQLDSAREVTDLLLPPSNRLEALSGTRSGQWSIRINDQWRICFSFANG
ncbi:MAG: type II toxin-antitoxin system RelE/ParE family toxin [Geobacter sp.]|nr:MAG: type II toxin-antitoxin system RelE/ParE family toxin [Geobacter sp.]